MEVWRTGSERDMKDGRERRNEGDKEKNRERER